MAVISKFQRQSHLQGNNAHSSIVSKREQEGRQGGGRRGERGVARTGAF